jgi:hypothetical protein
MTSESTWAHKSAMAPAARRERAEMSDGRKPTDGPMIAVEQRRAVVMSAGRIKVSAGDV